MRWIAILVGLLLVCLAYFLTNRYEVVSVNGSTTRYDRMTGKTWRLDYPSWVEIQEP
jgi:hypothetical protein